jgi:hypothetical protein
MHAVPLDRSWIKEFIEIWNTWFERVVIFLQFLQVHRFIQKLKGFLEKKWRGPESRRPGRHRTGPAHLVRERAGAAPGRADRGAQPSAAAGTRSGMGRRWPSDLNKIDGPASSPTLGCGKQGGNPSSGRDPMGAHLEHLSVIGEGSGRMRRSWPSWRGSWRAVWCSGPPAPCATEIHRERWWW